MNLHEHLPAFERGNLDFIYHERLALFDQNGGGCFQLVLTEARRCEGLGSGLAEGVSETSHGDTEAQRNGI